MLSKKQLFGKKHSMQESQDGYVVNSAASSQPSSVKHRDRGQDSTITSAHDPSRRESKSSKRNTATFYVDISADETSDSAQGNNGETAGNVGFSAAELTSMRTPPLPGAAGSAVLLGDLRNRLAQRAPSQCDQKFASDIAAFRENSDSGGYDLNKNGSGCYVEKKDVDDVKTSTNMDCGGCEQRQSTKREPSPLPPGKNTFKLQSAGDNLDKSSMECEAGLHVEKDYGTKAKTKLIPEPPSGRKNKNISTSLDNLPIEAASDDSKISTNDQINIIPHRPGTHFKPLRDLPLSVKPKPIRVLPLPGEMMNSENSGLTTPISGRQWTASNTCIFPFPDTSLTSADSQQLCNSSEKISQFAKTGNNSVSEELNKGVTIGTKEDTENVKLVVPTRRGSLFPPDSQPLQVSKVEEGTLESTNGPPLQRTERPPIAGFQPKIPPVRPTKPSTANHSETSAAGLGAGYGGSDIPLVVVDGSEVMTEEGGKGGRRLQPPVPSGGGAIRSSVPLGGGGLRPAFPPSGTSKLKHQRSFTTDDIDTGLHRRGASKPNAPPAPAPRNKPPTTPQLLPRLTTTDTDISRQTVLSLKKRLTRQRSNSLDNNIDERGRSGVGDEEIRKQDQANNRPSPPMKPKHIGETLGLSLSSGRSSTETNIFELKSAQQKPTTIKHISEKNENDRWSSEAAIKANTKVADFKSKLEAELNAPFAQPFKPTIPQTTSQIISKPLPQVPLKHSMLSKVVSTTSSTSADSDDYVDAISITSSIQSGQSKAVAFSGSDLRKASVTSDGVQNFDEYKKMSSEDNNVHLFSSQLREFEASSNDDDVYGNIADANASMVVAEEEEVDSDWSDDNWSDESWGSEEGEGGEVGGRDVVDAELRSVNQEDVEKREQEARVRDAEGRAREVEEARLRAMSREQRVAEELLQTERQYVDKLHLMDQVFYKQLLQRNREERFLPDDILPQIFSNITSIYQFHHDFLLPQLQSTMDNWDSGARIGEVLKKLAPFLKLYTDYVKNFDQATNVMNAWLVKSPKFAAIMDELHLLPECGQLTLQHHLIGPIQRVPRYKLLLESYIKNLPDDCPDQSDAKEALALVAQAAEHSCEAVRKTEKFRKLLDINEMLGGSISDLISASRELVKEGRMIKISARDGDEIERYLFLFNDLLLVCQSVPIKIGLWQQYVLKAKLDIDGMITLQKVIDDYKERSTTRSVIQGLPTTSTPMRKEDSLGRRAPTWIKDQETSMCMICCLVFTTFKRRHHCRACGKVICSNCSTQKMALAYDDNRENRVCDECYKRLRSTRTNAASWSLSPREEEGVDEDEQRDELRPMSGIKPPNPVVLSLGGAGGGGWGGGGAGGRGVRKASSLLRVKATEDSVLADYLQISSDRKIWRRRFISVHKTFVLYFYKARRDTKANMSLPLPGYHVSAVTDTPEDIKQHVFKVFHKGQSYVYYFQAENQEQMKLWIDVLSKVVALELPGNDIISEQRATSSIGSSRYSDVDQHSTHEVSRSITDPNRYTRQESSDPRLSNRSSVASQQLLPSALLQALNNAIKSHPLRPSSSSTTAQATSATKVADENQAAAAVAAAAVAVVPDVTAGGLAMFPRRQISTGSVSSHCSYVSLPDNKASVNVSPNSSLPDISQSERSLDLVTLTPLVPPEPLARKPPPKVTKAIPPIPPKLDIRVKVNELTNTYIEDMSGDIKVRDIGNNVSQNQTMLSDIDYSDNDHKFDKMELASNPTDTEPAVLSRHPVPRTPLTVKPPPPAPAPRTHIAAPIPESSRAVGLADTV